MPINYQKRSRTSNKSPKKWVSDWTRSSKHGNFKFLKLPGDKGITALTKLFQSIYDTGIYPSNWLKSSFVMIPKKSRGTRCYVIRLRWYTC